MNNYNTLSQSQKQAHLIDQANWNNPQLLRVVTKDGYVVETKRKTFQHWQLKVSARKVVDRYIKMAFDPTIYVSQEAITQNNAILRSHRNDNEPKPNQQIVSVNHERQ